jgi:hypothetical protein
MPWTCLGTLILSVNTSPSVSTMISDILRCLEGVHLEAKGRGHPMTCGTDHRDREVERTTTILLAEFAARRSEIDTRANVLVSLILGNLTVLGVVLGIALSQSGNKNVLLLLPIVTPCIGLLVIDTFRNVDFLNKYIRTVIRPGLSINDEKLFDWERQSANFGFRLWLAGPFQLVLWLEFLGPPIAVLIYTMQHHLRYPYVWWTGAVLTVILLSCALGYGGYSLFSKHGTRRTLLGPYATTTPSHVDD